LRTALGYRSAPRRFRVAFEVEDVTDVGAGDQHDNAGAGSLWNGITDRPVVADPEDTEWNEAYVSWHAGDEVEIAAGRRELVFDDHRFLGNAGFRQNHQSFDTLHARVDRIPRTRLDYGFLHRFQTVTGGDLELDGHVAAAPIDVGSLGTATPYFLYLDFESAALLSTRTFGASLTGERTVGSWKLPYRGELAWQEDLGDNPARVDADYRRVEIAGKKKGWRLGLGHETLGATSGGIAFATPLATLHRFNGAADKFLTTPADGLVDLYGQAGYVGGPWTAVVELHDFDADRGSASHGTEVDGEVVYRAPWKQQFALNVAVFDSDRPGLTDAEKYWASTSYAF
jgi:hypothetical protein